MIYIILISDIIYLKIIITLKTLILKNRYIPKLYLSVKKNHTPNK